MYESVLRAKCSKLDQADMERAKARAMQVLALLQSAPASPGEDWEPTMPGFPPIATSRAAPQPLITTVPPLDDDGGPKPLPVPKGCPRNP